MAVRYGWLGYSSDLSTTARSAAKTNSSQQNIFLYFNHGANEHKSYNLKRMSPLTITWNKQTYLTYQISGKLSTRLFEMVKRRGFFFKAYSSKLDNIVNNVNKERFPLNFNHLLERGVRSWKSCPGLSRSTQLQQNGRQLPTTCISPTTAPHMI